ncbi:hypothetical protein GCM10010919_03440 [Alishewanella longhuensis]|uniref:Tetratricopeptide repeat protein n=1 Tax=Alishewanella longhuensis TaxID=1091037 RepID=A0ABQ3KU00_9ALTE|nr:hypothetical protein [Alishewanella longhuensis]GHG60194.1 hypothetical protein GCM10010919_03440 [Alishewanella longhuensis]
MINTITRLIACALPICFTAIAQAASAETNYGELEQAYYHRQYSLLASKLNTLDAKDVRIEILEVALAVATNQQDKEAQLEALVARHPDTAQVRYVAGKLWYQIKQQSSLFNKLGLVDKSNENYIIAAKLEPENPQYLVEAAKALAIKSGFFDTKKQASKAIVDKLAQLDQRSYYLALMDYLQNTQNAADAKKTVTIIRAEFNDDVVLLNRAANLLWTFAEKPQAQQLFVASCKVKTLAIAQFPQWREACLSAAYLALQDYGDKQQALEALALLLSEDKVKDEQYVEYLMLYAELNKAMADKDAAIRSYQQALALTTTGSTQKEIRTKLKRLTN